MVLSVDDSTASSATTAWDETDKRDTLANTIDDLGETILKAVRERLNVEHYAHADETDQDGVIADTVPYLLFKCPLISWRPPPQHWHSPHSHRPLFALSIPEIQEHRQLSPSHYPLYLPLSNCQ